jgi:mRNA-degrading endonuclease toxin of MazEF toxin-antitoxin module
MSCIVVCMNSTKLCKSYGTHIELHPTKTSSAINDSTLLLACTQIKLGELL